MSALVSRIANSLNKSAENRRHAALQMLASQPARLAPLCALSGTDFGTFPTYVDLFMPNQNSTNLRFGTLARGRVMMSGLLVKGGLDPVFQARTSQQCQLLGGCGGKTVLHFAA